MYVHKYSHCNLAEHVKKTQTLVEIFRWRCSCFGNIL